MKKASFALLSLVFLVACHSPAVQQTQEDSSASSSLSVSPETLGKEFRNDKYGIKFSIPSDWNVELGKELSLPKFTGFTMATFESPETKKHLDEAHAHPEMYQDSEGPGGPDLALDVHPDFINTQSNGLIFYSDKKFTSLTDFFSNAGKKMEKVRARQISGETAYEASDNGDFVFLVPHKGNLFVFTIWYLNDMTGNWLLPDSMEDKILQSIELY